MDDKTYPLKELTGSVIVAAMEVHTHLGCGFLESVYEEALALELRSRGIEFVQQQILPVSYKGVQIKTFTCDLLVEGKLLVELKALKNLTEIEFAQVINYLKVSKLKIGLLLNFGTGSLQYKRMIS